MKGLEVVWKREVRWLVL